jgi:hypothetical protein
MELNDQALRARVAKRRGEAIKLRLACATYQQIADSDLYPEGATGAYVYMDIKRAYEQAKQQLDADIGLLRVETVLRYDRLLLALWPQAMAGSVRAVEACVKIMDKRGDVTGEKAAAVIRHTWESESEIDRAIRDLRTELDEQDRQVAAAQQTGGAEGTPPAGR